MSKELTEQWREGTLPEGYYYVNGKWINYYSKDDGYFNDGGVEEVLAPVPSYEEYRELLDLNVYEKDRKKVMGLEDKVKRLQEQLKEANELLKGLYDDSPCQFDHNGYCQEHGSTDGNYICVQGELKEYLERYGVK